MNSEVNIKAASGPLVRDVYVDVQLTDVSVRYSNENYFADRIFPVVMVPKRTGLMYKYDKANLKAVDSRRAGVERAQRVEYGLSKVSYGPLIEHSLEEAIEKDVIDEAVDPLDPKIDAVNNISERMLVEKEVALATLLSDTAQVGNTKTLSSGAQWSNYNNSDPFRDIEDGRQYIRENALKEPNTVFMSSRTWTVLKNHPGMLDRVKYTQLPALTEQLFKDLFPGVETLYVMAGMQNSAADGATDYLEPIWGPHAWVAYITPQPGIRTVSLGYTLTLNGGRYVDGWEELEHKASLVRVNDYYQQYIVAKECAYLIKNAVNYLEFTSHSASSSVSPSLSPSSSQSHSLSPSSSVSPSA
jgi:hypothetical protein